jgi:hypothetical protein
MAIWDGQVTVALMRYATSACKGTILTTRGMIAAKMPRQKKKRRLGSDWVNGAGPTVCGRKSRQVAKRRGHFANAL